MTTQSTRQLVGIQDIDGRIHRPDDLTYIYKGTPMSEQDPMTTATAEMFLSRAEKAEAEVERLRQGLWDCAVEAGMDHDGDLTPKHCATDVVDVALSEVRQLRHDYEEELGGGLA